MKKFDEVLNYYMSHYGITARELSDISGLSSATISRYRSGERTPVAGSEQLSSLIDGITSLAAERPIDGEVDEAIADAFTAAVNPDAEDYDNVIAKFNTLVSVLNISMGKLAKSMNFDTSYLFRIKSGQRRPADLSLFVEGVCAYVASISDKDDACRRALPELIQQDNCDNIAAALSKWMYDKKISSPDYMNHFLTHLDSFDLNEYIKEIHFDEMKIPTVPITLPKSRNYYGLEDMKSGELDFFKTSVLSKKSESIFMCSDMAMEDMAEDKDFGKKWMAGLAFSLKKGFRINIIHNLNRPINEMMLGLESWIPLYMTGLVSPYYLKDYSDHVYSHLLYVSESAALSGECIAGHHDSGRYYLTTNKSELTYYSKRAEDLLASAHPLMEIFSEENENELNACLAAGNISAEDITDIDASSFKNITIRAYQNKLVLITKSNAPRMHFLIRHPRLVKMIIEFKPPYTE